MTRTHILDLNCRIGHTVLKCQWEQNGESCKAVGVFSGYERSRLIALDTSDGRCWPPIGHAHSQVWKVEPENLAERLNTNAPINPDDILTQLW